MRDIDVWRPLPDWLGGEQPYDLNSWQESETALNLADTLDEDAVIVEGYAEYATWRPHLAYLRDPYGDPDMEMDIDGVGGVSILAKAKVFRSGVHFPAFSFEKHAETEGFGKVFEMLYLARWLLTVVDGKKDAVLGCRFTTLHYLAFIRTQRG
jgi:mannan polymerase II complex ANP1 subunit